MAKTKVVFITTDYSVAGGIERSLSVLTKTLMDDLDVDVTLISCGKTREMPFFSFPEKIKIIEIKKGKSLLKLSSVVDKIEHVILPRMRYSNILRTLANLEFDFLVVDHPILLSALPNKNQRKWKILLHAHEALRSKKTFANRLYYRGIHKVDKVIALTEEDKQHWLDFGLSKVEKIHHYIDARAVNFPDERENSVACVARFVPDKGVDRVIKAFSILLKKDPTVQLKIYGDGPERHKYLQLCTDLNISTKVIFAGYTDNPVQELTRSKVMALGSRIESFGYVILESFLAGTPVVAFDGPPGPRELIDETNGRLIPEDDLDGFAKSLEYFLHSDLRINVITSKDSYIKSWKKSLEIS